MDRIRKIRNSLDAVFGDAEIMIKDQSHLHANHAGAEDGRGHFDVRIVSSRFGGCSRIERHKMVYDALSELMKSDIHAVRIRAETPAET